MFAAVRVKDNAQSTNRRLSVGRSVAAGWSVDVKITLNTVERLDHALSGGYVIIQSGKGRVLLSNRTFKFKPRKGSSGSTISRGI